MCLIVVNSLLLLCAWLWIILLWICNFFTLNSLNCSCSTGAYSTFIFHWQISGILEKMLDSAEKLGKDSLNGRGHVREDSEYVRLVISDEPRLSDTLQPQAETKKSFIWWIKAILWCFIAILLLLIFMKWGVPFIFEKVFPYLAFFFVLCARWECILLYVQLRTCNKVNGICSSFNQSLCKILKKCVTLNFHQGIFSAKWLNLSWFG